MLVDDDTLMTFGGLTRNDVNNEVNRVLSYRISTRTWTERAPMRTKRYSAACGLAGANKIIVAGGSFTASTEIYDIAQNRWTTGKTKQNKT